MLPLYRDGAAKQARVDAGAEALAAAAAATEAAGADGAEAGASEAGTTVTEETQSAGQTEQPADPAAAAEPDTSSTTASTESASALPTETATEPVDAPAADAAGSTGTSAGAAEVQGSDGPAAAPAAAPAPAAAAGTDSQQPQETAMQPVQTEAASAPTSGSEPASSTDQSLPPLERPAARAMVQEVDALLKKELAFLREIETKFGNRPGANGKPAGARKRRSESRASALVEPLAMDFSSSASAMDSQFRSPRTPKPNSRWTQPKATRGVSAALRPFVQVLDRMMKHPDAAGFTRPVNELWSIEMLPGYYDIVKRPMDLGTIKTRLNEGQYGDNPEAFAADVRLVWKNCMTYNNPETEFHHTADRMRLLFEQAYNAASEKSVKLQEKEELKRQSSQAAQQPRQSRPKAEPKPKPARASKPKKERPSKPKPSQHKSKKRKKEKSYASSSLDAVEMMNANLERVLSRMGGATVEPEEEKVLTRTMELWEKERLVKMMDKLEPENFGTALSIIKQSHRVNLDEVESDEEVTIDIDTLDSKTLWKLHKYVEDNIPKKRKQSKKISQAEKQRLDRERISQREQSLREELSQLQGNLAAAAAGSDSSSSSDSSSDSDSD